MELKSIDIVGKDIVIKGELQGEQDLIIEGRVEGAISLKKHLIVDKTGSINADAQVENITVKGRVNGNIIAADKVEISTEAKVSGDIKAPRLVIEDGAKYNGLVEMDVSLPDDI